MKFSEDLQAEWEFREVMSAVDSKNNTSKVVDVLFSYFNLQSGAELHWELFLLNISGGEIPATQSKSRFPGEGEGKLMYGAQVD